MRFAIAARCSPCGAVLRREAPFPWRLLHKTTFGMNEYRILPEATIPVKMRVSVGEEVQPQPGPCGQHGDPAGTRGHEAADDFAERGDPRPLERAREFEAHE